MVIESAQLALVMLSELPYVGEHTVTRLSQVARQQQKPLCEILALPPAQLANEYQLPARAIAQLGPAIDRHEQRCRHLLERLASVGVRLLQPSTPGYPLRWIRRLAFPPPVVYAHGLLNRESAPTLAVLSSRTITDRTAIATAHAIRSGVDAGYTVVTGGMKSTHRIAAVATRAAAAPRVVVLDRGIVDAFEGQLERDPFGFGPGRSTYDRNRTLALSSFRPLDHAAPRNGRRRDELVAALADVIVAVHARPGGEIEATCLRALDRGQCVVSSQGENQALVAAGAAALDEGDLGALLRRIPAIAGACNQ